jgi:hypothetical protein
MSQKNIRVIEVPASGKTTWMGGAYTIAFVRSKSGNFILKGYMREIEEYLKENYTHYFANLTLYHKGKSRNIWRFWKDNVSLWESKTPRGRKYYTRGMEFRFTNPSTGKRESMRFKRLPNKWIPELEKL